MKNATPQVIFSATLILTSFLFAQNSAKAQALNLYPAATGVNDSAKLLTPKDEEAVRTALTDLRSEAGVEMAVVTIRSIRGYKTGDKTIESFATNLFNTRGIGNRSRNDGVLILVSIKDRKVRIELGSGYGSGYNAQMQSVINEQMLPRFKKKEYSRGILEGTKAVIRILSERPSTTSLKPTPASDVPIGIQAGSYSSNSNDGLSLLTVLGWAAAVIAVGLGVRWYVRSRYRDCPKCGVNMVRLDRWSGDKFLDPGQQREASVGSVEYKVWHCAACAKHHVEGNPRWSSSFNACNACNYRTLEISRETVVYPTQYSSGTEQITRVCHHCGFSDHDTSILPMLPTSTYSRYNQYNSFSSFNSSSSDYSSSSYDSSSSSASSSFDSSSSDYSSSSDSGGSSSGDGSSGSW
jgi:uncharacterized protein